MIQGQDVYYFGCWSREQKGHYLYTHGGSHAWEVERALPWASIDGSLCPGYQPRHATRMEEQVQGRAALHQCGGWSVLAWWDRTADVRGGSNAAFVGRGLWTADALLAAGAERFPLQMARMAAAYSIVVVSMPTAQRSAPVTCFRCGGKAIAVHLPDGWISLPPGWLQRGDALACSPGCAVG